MKKFFSVCLSFTLIVLITSFSHQAEAQLVKPVAASKTVLANTDTSYLNFEVDAISKSVEAHVTKVSGTVAGTAIFQGTVDGTNYDDLGSALTLANQAINYKVFDLHASTGNQIYAKYRIRLITSGTCSVSFKGYLLKRSN